MSILQLEGAYENELATTGDFNPHAPKTALMLPSGQRVVLPTEVLLEALGRMPADAEVQRGVEAPPSAAAASDAGAARRGGADDAVIPMVEEQIEVSKRAVETARLRVRRETQEHVQKVSVPLTDVRWEVEHVPVEQRVEAQPEIRQVGETIVFPLVEERLVVKRELWLREEVHVRKVTTVVEKSADFPVKRDVLVEQRSGVGNEVRGEDGGADGVVRG